MCGDIQVVVLGGLTVDVTFTTTGYDNRDCGGGHNDIDEWSIVGINGKPKKNTDWLLKRLSAADEAEITEACYASLH